MASSSLVYAIMVQWAAQFPVLLVYLLGIILSLIYGRSCRVSSVLTLCAMILLGALTLGLPAVTLNLVRWQHEHYWTTKQFGFVSLSIKLISSAGHAVGVGLLLAAVFHRRSARATNLPPGLPPPLPSLSPPLPFP